MPNQQQKTIYVNQVGVYVPEQNFTLMGMAGLITGVMHAPLTGIFLIADPTSGEYYLDGIAVRSMDKNARATLRNRKIGFVFQNYDLLAKTTALENVELPASAGYHFVKWTDKDGNTVSTTLNFVPQKVNGVNVPATYTANFVENDDITINYVAHTGGSVSLGSETIAPVNGTCLLYTSRCV